MQKQIICAESSHIIMVPSAMTFACYGYLVRVNI